MTRYGKAGVLILGIIFLVIEPIALWGQESSAPPPGKTGSSRKLPSGRSRVAPTPQIPRVAPQQVPAQPDVFPKGKQDEAVVPQSVIEPVGTAPSGSVPELPPAATHLGPIPGRSRPVQKAPENELSDEEPVTAPSQVASPAQVETVPPYPVRPPDRTTPEAADIPLGEQEADPASVVQSVEREPARRLPSGRSRPTPIEPQVETTVAQGRAPTQFEIEEFQRNNFIPIRDRWRIGYRRNLLDPYSQNLLKGDYPILGQNIFFNFTGISDSLFEARQLPTPQGVSRERAGSAEFFGEGRQLFFNQNFVLSFELFKGSTAFRPRDWALRVTPVVNVNYLDVQERGVVNLDVRDGTTRTDTQIAFQEAFVEKRLFNVSRNFDSVSVRVGIQGFTSDFRGFIFSDNEPGIRFFGNFSNNRYQWNAAYFNFLEKDTNSGLNSFETRHRQLFVVNLYKQDFVWQGYTAQVSFHHDRDDSGTGDPNGQQYDRNGFLVRPARLGDTRPHEIRSYYLGWAGDGHIGRWNISHAFYQVLGNVSHEQIAGRPTTINAQFAAAEVSYDIDWLRPKVSALYASGDRNPTDGTARGFDSILDNVNFAGNGFSFYNRQGIGLTQTGVLLTNRFSLLNDFRSSKTQGQAQFVNPGIIVANVGLDAELTPKLKGIVNFNYLWFAETEPLQYVLHQPQVRRAIGADYSVGLIYRPLLSQNIMMTGGFAYFSPGGGFKDIQQGGDRYSAFFAATLTF
jgi:hypothetical protein